MSAKADVRKTRRVCKRRRKPGELATPLVAIRNHCLECCGYNAAETARCTDRRCWLYPYRWGNTRHAVGTVRAEAESCAGAASSAREGADHAE